MSENNSYLSTSSSINTNNNSNSNSIPIINLSPISPKPIINKVKNRLLFLSPTVKIAWKQNAKKVISPLMVKSL